MQGSKEGQNNTTIISLLCEAEPLGQMLERALGTLQSEYLRMPDSGMYPQILISISILQQRDKAFKTGPNSGSLLIAPCQPFPRMSKNLEHF